MHDAHTCMKSSMYDHLIPRGKCFPAELAAVGSRIRVNSFMFSEEISTLKVLRTVGALERSLVCMDTADMEEKFPLPCVPGTTDITDVRFLSCMGSTVFV